jgi:ABC-type multidrug transport system fused ATPase/permease subunit
MQNLIKIYSFGWIYLRRYWVRFLWGVLMGVAFGMLNASFLWATNTLFQRLDPPRVAAAFTPEDIVNLPALANKLSARTNALSTYLLNRFPELPTALARFDASPASSNTLHLTLIQEFGEAIKGPLFYEERLFAPIPLPEETVRLAKTKPEGPKLQRLNRLLLEGAFPDELAKSPKIKWHAAIMADLNHAVQQAIDPWLPKKGRGLDWRQVVGGLFLFPLLVAVWSLAGYLSSYSLAWVSERVVNDLRLDVLTKLNTLSLDYFNRSTMGNLLTHINGDTAARTPA